MKSSSFAGLFVAILFLATVMVAGCGDDEENTEADDLGIGAQCETNDDCTEEGQECLLDFKGGYCGVKDCASSEDCPEGSACVTHDDDVNYCFRTCVEKTDCNVNREDDVAANCSASVTYVDDDESGKACIPPTGD